MKFTDNLFSGTLIKRYKRFFVDVRVNNKTITAHCPNSGSMMGLLDKNNKVWISKSKNPKRKLKYTLELIKVKDSLVGVNTIFANKIVFEALNDNSIKELRNFKNIKKESFYDKETRFDFLLEKSNKRLLQIPKNLFFLDCKKKIFFLINEISSKGEITKQKN